MKVGDIVVAMVPLYINGSGFNTKTFNDGVVTKTYYDTGGFLVDVNFDGETAHGCAPGRHVELHPANGSPLMEALK